MFRLNAASKKIKIYQKKKKKFISII